ncbi:protein LURP-one-related 17 [Ricinus communis]|uniref:protein LURP-one-related 17 n=1 Tax=Ricinus communis TaxID=3988 RepID=UPI0007728131|nr:protein LURP-one-related 17 [Ricinus communis]|eukprot:XP_015584531.1 protein LURP-one-related 17 [Ricinus communis]
MKKFFFLKSLSRSVHDEEDHQQQNETKIADDGGTCTSLTVWRKSLIINCNGFTVINSHGDLAYRVDSYMVRPHELILMDGSGKSVLTVHRRKKLGLGDNWEVCAGEVGRYCSTTTELTKKPIWSVKKHISILRGNDNVLAHVYRGSCIEKRNNYSYVIEGSYRQRSCKIMDESRNVVAEIKRKEAMVVGVSFGVEVFLLVVQPGFDPGFAMALVLLLDQMFS